MTLRTILLHLANDPGHRVRLDVALDLARRHGAEIRALFAEPEADMPGAMTGRGFSYAFISASREAAAEAAQVLLKELRSACEAASIGCDWRDEEGDPLDLIERFAMLADLVVVGRGAGGGLEAEACEELPARVPCPVLTIPDSWSTPAVGHRVLVAWKPGLPAARALRGAIAILKKADAVTLLTVGSTDESSAEATAYLTGHDVRVTPRHDYGDAGDAGEVIVGVAREMQADLIVMGSYSRSRFRELVLGGTTRHVVTHMEVPILFAH